MIELLEKLMTEEEVHDKWVVFDFDGVCSSYKEGWQGSDVFGDAVEGVADLISELRRDGFKVSLFTTRGETPALKDWLSTNRFVFDSINDTSHNPKDAGTAKPIAELYVDDRAVRFSEDDVEASIADIKSKLSANESFVVCGNGQAILDKMAEAFADQFKPASDDEIKRRFEDMSDDDFEEEVYSYLLTLESYALNAYYADWVGRPNADERGIVDGLKKNGKLRQFYKQIVLKMYEDKFEDTFKPISGDELEKRHEEIIQTAVDQGMKRLKAGDTFMLRPLSKVESSRYSRVVQSDVFVTSDFDGEPSPTVVYQAMDGHFMGAIWKEHRNEFFWYPALSRFWAEKNKDKIKVRR